MRLAQRNPSQAEGALQLRIELELTYNFDPAPRFTVSNACNHDRANGG